MKVLLWLLGFTLCLAPTLFTLTTQPFSLYKRYGGIVETEFSFTPAHTHGFLLSSLLVSFYLYFTRKTLFTFKTLIQTIRAESLAKPLTLFFIIGFTGVMHTLIYSNFIVNFTVAFIYFLGFLGLFSMWQSLKHKEKNGRWLMLLFGFMSVLIAFFALESLLKEYGRR